MIFAILHVDSEGRPMLLPMTFPQGKMKSIISIAMHPLPGVSFPVNDDAKGVASIGMPRLAE